MPIPIDEVEEDPVKIYMIEMDIVDFLEQNPKLAYNEEELFKKFGKKFESNNFLINVMAKSLFAMDLELIFQKGYIRKGKKVNEKYYFSTLKSGS